MLHGQGGQVSSSIPNKECRPDYEQMIASAKKSLVKNQNLQDALFDYVGIQTVSGKLAEMLGELVSENRQILARIEHMIAEQEKS